MAKTTSDIAKENIMNNQLVITMVPSDFKVYGSTITKDKYHQQRQREIKSAPTSFK